MKASLSVIKRGARFGGCKQDGFALWQRPQVRTVSASRLTIEKVADDTGFNSRPAKEDLVFGTTLSDHMLTVEWDAKNDWGAPTIVPCQNLSLSPAASCLHYGKNPSKHYSIPPDTYNLTSFV